MKYKDGLEPLKVFRSNGDFILVARDYRAGSTYSWSSKNFYLRTSVDSMCEVITVMADVFVTVHINPMSCGALVMMHIS